MTITAATLQNDTDWNDLQAALEGTFASISAVRGVLARAREIGTASVILEGDYLDRDFSAEFAQFYARVFKRFPKLCRRFHFFAEDVVPLLSHPDPQKIAEDLSSLSAAGKYLGYIVARPVAHAPLCRVVLAQPASPPDLKVDLLVRSEFVVHLLGSVLSVTSTPFTQQDARVGACAQAAIWMAARHFYSKHRGSLWVSTVDITEAASKPTDHMLSLALPAGSGGLTVEHMVRALRAIGREPLLYHGSYDAKNGQMTWPTSIAPTAVIDRYVDSGIPVIVGLAPWAGQSEFHAVVAVGHALHELNPGKSLPNDPTRSEWVRFLVVNDHQRGTSLRLPVASSDPLSETPYNVSHIVYIIVPLPGKVFTPAEAAEKIGWDMIRRYQAEWPILKTTYATQMAGATNAGDQFTDQIAQNQVVARTYLTYGWRYKQRMVRNTCSDTLKNAVFQHDFPRFVWVTEFGTRASLNHLDETQIRIFAHSVVDATSSRFWEGRCIFHAPGFVWRRYHDLNNPFADYVNSITPIATEMPYGMKIRGSYPGRGP